MDRRVVDIEFIFGETVLDGRLDQVLWVSALGTAFPVRAAHGVKELEAVIKKAGGGTGEAGR